MFSSQSGEWETPEDLFELLDKEFDFTVDVCGTIDSAKHSIFWVGESGLYRSWTDQKCFMNPPYGKTIAKWIKKAHIEARVNGVLTVALLPARTDTKWFWNYILEYNYEIRLLKGRLTFSNYKSQAPFPSMIVIFK